MEGSVVVQHVPLPGEGGLERTGSPQAVSRQQATAVLAFSDGAAWRDTLAVAQLAARTSHFDVARVKPARLRSAIRAALLGNDDLNVWQREAACLVAGLRSFDVPPQHRAAFQRLVGALSRGVAARGDAAVDFAGWAARMTKVVGAAGRAPTPPPPFVDTSYAAVVRTYAWYTVVSGDVPERDDDLRDLFADTDRRRGLARAADHTRSLLAHYLLAPADLAGRGRGSRLSLGEMVGVAERLARAGAALPVDRNHDPTAFVHPGLAVRLQRAGWLPTAPLTQAYSAAGVGVAAGATIAAAIASHVESGGAGGPNLDRVREVYAFLERLATSELEAPLYLGPAAADTALAAEDWMRHVLLALPAGLHLPWVRTTESTRRMRLPADDDGRLALAFHALAEADAALTSLLWLAAEAHRHTLPVGPAALPTDVMTAHRYGAAFAYTTMWMLIVSEAVDRALASSPSSDMRAFAAWWRGKRGWDAPGDAYGRDSDAGRRTWATVAVATTAWFDVLDRERQRDPAPDSWLHVSVLAAVLTTTFLAESVGEFVPDREAAARFVPSRLRADNLYIAAALPAEGARVGVPVTALLAPQDAAVVGSIAQRATAAVGYVWAPEGVGHTLDYLVAAACGCIS